MSSPKDYSSLVLPLSQQLIIAITDKQSYNRVRAPRAPCYIINIASYKNGALELIDGWSESIINYIRELELSH